LVSGDNSPETDGIIKLEDMIGIITRIERNGRDVHLGLGVERTLIAILSRGNGLLELKKMWHLPHIILANILRRMQTSSLYRIVGRQITPRINITEANADDVVAVQRHFNPNELDDTQVPDPSVTNWVAKYRQRVIGFVQLVRQPPGNGPYVSHWLYSLEVWSLYRGLGIGERLTQCVIDRAAAEGASELFLFVFEDNRGAIMLYNKVGFEQIISPEHEVQLAAEKEQFGRRRVVMSKKLA
jgi:ribosomal protein S18 acetylase RimI-like enzyme